MTPLASYTGVRKWSIKNTWSSWRRFLPVWMIKHNKRNKAMLEEDSSLAQALRGAWSFLSRGISLCAPTDIWPYNSPNLNSEDYWMSSVLGGKSNSYAHASISDLKKPLIQTGSEIYSREFWRTCSAFWGHLKRKRYATKAILSKVTEYAWFSSCSKFKIALFSFN